MFEKLLISRDTHNNRVEFDVYFTLGNRLQEGEYSPPPPSIPPKIKGNATRKKLRREEEWIILRPSQINLEGGFGVAF